MKNRERAIESGAVKGHGSEGSLLNFLSYSCLRCDCDSGVNLNRAFDSFDVVKLHYGLGFNLVVAEDLVHRFSSRDIGIEADELVLPEGIHIHIGVAREWVLGMANGDEPVLPKRNYFNLSRLYGEGHQPEIDGIVEDVLVHEIGATILDANVDRRIVGEERFYKGGEFVESDAVDGGNSDGAADDFLHFHQLAHELIVDVQDLFGRLVDAVPLSR